MASSHERVLTACAFQRPDRIPRFDSFWQFPESWRRRFGDPETLTDIAIWCPDESPFPTRARPLREEGGYLYEIDCWGRTIRRRPDAYFVETLAVAIPDGTDPDQVRFDAPEVDFRYLTGKMDGSATFPSAAELDLALHEDKQRHCVFGKTGGPYLRSSFVRGESQFLLDMAADPARAKAIADKLADHLIAVGREQLRRWELGATGIWIYDDMAYNHAPMFSPRQFEQVLLPAYRRMIKAYKEAGAKYVFLHSDGNIRLLLDMLVDAGIDGINPLERRAQMNAVELRQRYPRLILTGGMCNTHTLVKGTRSEIENEARELIDLGRDGGVVIGTHSVSPEIPLGNYALYHDFCRTYGDFTRAGVRL
jgi:uroporphyrinogen decarboxylase